MKPLTELIKNLRPYIAIMRLNEQASALSALLFGALDAKFTNLPVILALTVGLYFISVASFVINEYVDARDTDKYSPRVRALVHKTVAPKFVFLLWLMTSAIGMTIFFYFGLYWQAVVSVVAGTLYSLPPIRLKARFPWDQLTVMFYLIFIPYSLGFSLQKLPFDQMITLPFITLLFFLGAAQGFHLLSDLKADKDSGLSNTPAILGYKTLMKIIIVFSFLALFGLLYLLYHHTHPWYYPLIFFTALSLLALGYARGNVYDEKKLITRLTWSTKTAISLGNWFVIYQIIYIYFLNQQ